jgi:hypothetical protein
MTKVLLHAVRSALVPTGVAAVTFVHTNRPDNEVEGWIYPTGEGAQGAASYKRQTIDRWLRESGLKGAPIDWFHPFQTWWLIVRQEGALPPPDFRAQAKWVTLAYRASWDRPPGNMQWSLRAKRRILRALPKRRSLV